MRTQKKNTMNLIMIGLLIIGITGLLVQGAIGAVNNGLSIGVIDMNSVMEYHPDIKEIDEAIQQIWAEANDKFQAQAEDLDELEAQQLAIELQTQAELAQSQLLQALQADIQEAVETVARKEGLDIIIEQGAVIDGGYDISQSVISELTK